MTNQTNQEPSSEAAIRTEQQRRTARSINEQAVALQQLVNAPPDDVLNKLLWTEARLSEAEQQRDELLTALKQTLDVVFNETAGKPKTHWVTSSIDQARAAIARAEKGQS